MEHTRPILLVAMQPIDIKVEAKHNEGLVRMQWREGMWLDVEPSVARSLAGRLLAAADSIRMT